MFGLFDCEGSYYHWCLKLMDWTVGILLTQGIASCYDGSFLLIQSIIIDDSLILPAKVIQRETNFFPIHSIILGEMLRTCVSKKCIRIFYQVKLKMIRMGSLEFFSVYHNFRFIIRSFGGAEKKRKEKDIKIHYSKNKIRMFLPMIKKTSYKFG